MKLTKTAAKALLKRDFIPRGGGQVKTEDLDFRPSKEYEVHQCCEVIGSDPQSGPLYCGNLAELIAIVKEDGIRIGVVGVCEKHKYLIAHRIKET